MSGGLHTGIQPRRSETRSPSKGNVRRRSFSLEHQIARVEVSDKTTEMDTESHLETLSLSRTHAGVLTRQRLLSLWSTGQRRSQTRSGTVVLRGTLETADYGLSASSRAVCPLRTGDWSDMTQWTVETWWNTCMFECRFPSLITYLAKYRWSK